MAGMRWSANGNATFGLNVRLEGKTVEGLTEPYRNRMRLAATQELADYTKFELIQRMDSVFKNQTGAYISRIGIHRVAADAFSINDGGVVYGPWLEGLGSRNYPRTRFKGYWSYKITRNSMAQKAKRIIDAWVERTVKVL